MHKGSPLFVRCGSKWAVVSEQVACVTAGELDTDKNGRLKVQLHGDMVRSIYRSFWTHQVGVGGVKTKVHLFRMILMLPLHLGHDSKNQFTRLW